MLPTYELWKKRVSRFSMLGKAVYTRRYDIPELNRGGSLFIRHLDCGSCNGCELEIKALMGPVYDLESLGIEIHASARHADVLMLTGTHVRNLTEATRLTFEAMSEPRYVISIGDCTGEDSLFKNSYAVTSLDESLSSALVVHIPGCPPTPEAILRGLAEAKQKMKEAKSAED